jgi:hypothetical protein
MVACEVRSLGLPSYAGESIFHEVEEAVVNNPEAERSAHLHNEEIVSMPDDWEYPWYAAWHLAFHVSTLAMIDPDFAKQQLVGPSSASSSARSSNRCGILRSMKPLAGVQLFLRYSESGSLGRLAACSTSGSLF